METPNPTKGFLVSLPICEGIREPELIAIFAKTGDLCKKKVHLED